MKMNKNGFTLVELLIVIALIAILSVAVLATINPIEQANKARDAKVQNDAAEVLSAYERYYASKNSYPWLDLMDDETDTVDAAFFSKANEAGFGLCTNASATTKNDLCTTSTTPGALVTSDELKSSFLNKEYTIIGANYKPENTLFLIKQSSTAGNNIYVCFVPKAKVNRTNTAGFKLKALTITNGLPTTIIDATEQQIIDATYATVTDNVSLFRCVPQ